MAVPRRRGRSLKSPTYAASTRHRRGQPTSQGSHSTKDEERKDRWDELVKPILAKYNAVPKSRKSTGETRLGFIRRDLYRVLRILKQTKEGRNIIEAAALISCKREPRKATVSRDPFYWGLKAFAKNCDLGSDRVTRLAREMNYADTRGVEPDLMAGFIKQIGVTNFRQMADKEIDEWHGQLLPEPTVYQEP